MIALTGAWEGWKITDDALISPTGRRFLPSDIEPEYYTQSELARALRISRNAVYDRMKRGTLPPFDKENKWHITTVKKILEEERMSKMKKITADVVYKDGRNETIEIEVKSTETILDAHARVGSELQEATNNNVAGISGVKGYVWVGHNGDGDLFNKITNWKWTARE